MADDISTPIVSDPNVDASTTPSGLENFVNQIPQYAKDTVSAAFPGVIAAYQGANAVAQALPEPTTPGPYQTAVQPIKNIISSTPVAPPSTLPQAMTPLPKEPINEDNVPAQNVQAAVNPVDKLQQDLGNIQNQFTGAINEQAAAKKAFSDANARQAAAEFEATKIQNAKADALAQQQQSERDRQLTEQNNSMDAYQAAVKDFEKQGPPDPDRYWSRASTGNKILAGISLLFGAGAQAYGAKTNPGIDAINTAIDRDLKMQTEAIQQKRDVAGMKQGILNQMYRKFDNLQAAQSASKMAMLEQAQRNMNTIAAQYASPKIKAQADEANAALNQEKAKIGLEFFKARASLKPNAITNYPPGQRIDDNTYNALDPKAKGATIVLPDGGKVLAFDNAAAGEYRKNTTNNLSAIEKIDRLNELYKNYNIADIPTKRKMDLEAASLQGDLLKTITGTTRYSPQTKDILDKTIGNPGKYFSIPLIEQAKLDELNQLLKNDTYNAARAASGYKDNVSSFKRK